MGQPVSKEELEDMQLDYMPSQAEVSAALEQADKMNENMRLYGTIDAPEDAKAFVDYNIRDIQVAEELTALAGVMKREQLVAEAVADGRKLVTVRLISDISDIPGADLIKVATVEGWKVVVKAGEFNPGDLCVFFEVDSYLPMDDERYKFLEKNAINWNDIPGARLKTIRLRKQLSQGLALPLSLFPEIIDHLIGLSIGKSEAEKIREINFTGVLGIMKWDKPVNAQLAGMAKGNFPSFLRKSDQERCQNMAAQIFGYEPTYSAFDSTGVPYDALIAMMNKGEVRYVKEDIGLDGRYERIRPAQASKDTRYEVSLKMDGSSMTVYTNGTDEERVQGVCSRNLDLKMEGNEGNSFVEMANSGLLKLLSETAIGAAIQGELMGPGIQGNRENFQFNRFFVYNVFDITENEFLTPERRIAFVAEMNATAKLMGIDVIVEHVPILHNDVTLAELGIHNMDDLLKFAIGPSLHNNVREGVVFKAMDGSHQFKAISNLYLEQEK